MKNQIIKASSHQFIEGDVLHWWHDEISKGVRTRFSDDLLWLNYVITEYINYTQDYEILDYEIPYLHGEILKDDENERYDLYKEGNKKESIYNHSIRSIEKAINFGENGLPKIGSGDWNDGFSDVGNKYKGESVWLGFFLYDILEKFIPICEYKEDIIHAVKFKEIKEKLKNSLNTTGWDGRWYKRAYMKDGNVLR